MQTDTTEILEIPLCLQLETTQREERNINTAAEQIAELLDIIIELKNKLNRDKLK